MSNEDNTEEVPNDIKSRVRANFDDFLDRCEDTVKELPMQIEEQDLPGVKKMLLGEAAKIAAMSLQTFINAVRNVTKTPDDIFGDED